MCQEPGGEYCVMDQELDRGQSPGTAAAAGKYANMIGVEMTESEFYEVTVTAACHQCAI